jgi:hypothetical protein
MKVTRGMLFDERFRVLVQKLIGAQTSGNNAYEINKLNSELKKKGQESEALIKSEFMEKFAQRDESGKIILMKDQDGNEIPRTWAPIEEKKTELDTLVDKFYQEEVELKCRPLRPATIADIKLSAFELELLGEIYQHENGPGLPGLHAL